MKSNLSTELFLAFERYFIENDEDVSLDKISSGFTDVVLGIEFLPQNMTEDIDKKKKLLKKYGFSSSTALAEDFRKRVLNIDEPIPEDFEKDGVTYQKIFVLKRGSYDLGVDYKIDNQSGQSIEVEPYGQLKHSIVESSGNVAMPTYTGGAYSSSETNYKKYSFGD